MKTLPLLAMFLFLLVSLVGCLSDDDPTQPTDNLPGSDYALVAHMPLPTANWAVSVLGDFAFIAAGQAGMHVIDISNPANPVLVAIENTTADAFGIETLRIVDNDDLIDQALIVEGTEGIVAIDISDPLAPFNFDQGTTAVDARRIFVQLPENPGERFTVFLAESWKGLRVCFSSPGNPGALNYPGVFASTLGHAKDVIVVGGWAYVAQDEMGLAVLDVRVLQLGNVHVVSWHDTPGHALGLAVEDGLAFVADGEEGLTIFTISQGNQPVALSQTALPGYCVDVVVRDDYAFVAAEAAGLHILDISDPAEPRHLETIAAGLATGLCVTTDGLVLVTDADEALLIVQGPAFTDNIAPAAVFALTAEVLTSNRVALGWYAAGDDRYHGVAESQEIRWSLTTISTESDWDAATPIAGTPAPTDPGTLQSFEVVGLDPGTTYHFAMKMFDDAGQSSPLSASVSATTLVSGTYLISPGVDPASGESEDTFTYEVSYQDSEADYPVVADVVIDGVSHALTYISGDLDDLALFRFETNLGIGTHNYLFAFDDGNGNTVETALVDGPIVGVASGFVFEMGSPLSELCRSNDEDRHTVVISNQIVASAHEVNQTEWEAIMLGNPSAFIGADLPVDGVTWFEAIDYCNYLSVDQGLTPAYTIIDDDVTWDQGADGWRLPTEAEWEWICRAGVPEAFHTGDIEDCDFSANLDEAGWYLNNSGGTTHSVGSKTPNVRNLYDMHGNVMEWCWDWAGDYPSETEFDPTGPSDGVARIARGGSWDHQPAQCRSAARTPHIPDSRNNFVGFRVVRTDFGI